MTREEFAEFVRTRMKQMRCASGVDEVINEMVDQIAHRFEDEQTDQYERGREQGWYEQSIADNPNQFPVQ